MKPHVKKFYSADIDNLDSFIPQNKDNFGFNFKAIVGATNKEGGESIDMTICTPNWLMEYYGLGAVINARNYFIVFKYDIRNIQSTIKKLIESCEANTWDECGNKMSKYGSWEFEDYREYGEIKNDSPKICPKVKSFVSADFNDLDSYVPPIKDYFSLKLSAIVSPENTKNEESIDMVVCTPEWLLQQYGPDAVISGSHLIIVFEYNLNKIKETMKQLLESCKANSWDECKMKMSKFGMIKS